MNPNLNYLARALYIPGLVAFLVGVWLLSPSDPQPAHAAVIGMFGAMCGILGGCAAIKAAGLINLPPKK